MKRAWCLAAAIVASASLAWAGDPAKVTLKVEGMTCGGCVAAVKVQLKKTEGVTAYEVSLEKGEAEVTYDPAKTEPKKIAASVSKTGFAASVKEPGASQRGTPEARKASPDATREAKAAVCPSRTAAAAKLRCTLTGAEITNCCCVQSDGKLFCTLAKRNVDACCCEAADKARAPGEPSKATALGVTVR